MQTDRITRAAWHERHFDVTPSEALKRADRELDAANYWTPWELRDSAYAAEYVEWFVKRTLTTVQ